MKKKETVKRRGLHSLMAAVCLALAAGIFLLTGCGSEDSVSDETECLDTLCTVTIYDMGKAKSKKLIEGAFEECQRLENLLSRTIADSDIDRINKAEGSPVTVSDETKYVLEKGLYYSRLSGGLFDITVGRLTSLWDFKAENPEIPEAGDLKAALKTIDYSCVSIEGNKVTLSDPEAEIDLGGIAKGYIADCLASYLEEEGVTRAIVNLGGNVVAMGSKSEDSGWNIGIERPYSDRSAIIGAVEIRDGTVVTSGIYERMFEIDGEIYHHILDVDTGYPASSDIEAVSIRADIGHSVDCDALSTICLILGQEKAMELIEGMEGYEASFITRDDEITSTEGMNLVEVE